MRIHPFKPMIFPETKKLLVGTLPPESATFYFSNSTNTRLWDILNSISNGYDVICTGSNNLDKKEKEKIIQKLQLGITDIIYQYERDDNNSTSDKDIDPKKYKNLLEIVDQNNIEQLLFVYKNAYQWFRHSLTGEAPIRIKKLSGKFYVGELEVIEINSKKINCFLLPAPLNRGRKNESLKFKLDFYRDHII